MKKRVSHYIVGATLLAVSGCSGDEADNASDMVGTATFELANAPADASCLRIVVAGSRTVSRLISLMPGEPTTFTLNGLPLGNVTFTESAFALDCGAVSDSSIATWQSDPTPATLQAGVAANVTVVLRRNGTANVTSDFQDDTPMCMPPQQVCATGGMSQCVDLTTDPNHCGSCANVCAPVTNAASVCASSMCTFICNVSFRDCNNLPQDGCETNIFNDPVNCGGCGVVCQPGTPCLNGFCGAPARIQVSPLSIPFPPTPVGAVSMPVPVRITNAGGSPLLLMLVTLAGVNPGDFTFFPLPPPQLAPGMSFTTQVTFRPSAQAPRTASLEIRSNDLMQPLLDVQLTGTGL